MSETMVDKKKAETAIRNGHLLQVIRDSFIKDKEKLKKLVREYEKINKVSFELSAGDISEKLRDYNNETKEIYKILEEFPEIRFDFLKERLARKIRLSDSDSISLTNTELLVIDRLLSDEFEHFCKKYSNRNYFLMDGELGVPDFFSDDEISKASTERKKTIATLIFLGLFLCLFLAGWLTFKYLEHNH